MPGVTPKIVARYLQDQKRMAFSIQELRRIKPKLLGKKFKSKDGRTYTIEDVGYTGQGYLVYFNTKDGMRWTELDEIEDQLQKYLN